MKPDNRTSVLTALILTIFVVSGFSSYAGAFSATSFTTKEIATVPAGLNPQFFAYDSSNNLIYVANLDAGGTYTRDTVSVISGTKNIANITVGESPYGIIYDPTNREIYVADSAFYAQSGKGDDNAGVSVINGEKLLETIEIPACFLIYNPSNKFVYVVGQDLPGIYVFNSANSQVGNDSIQGQFPGCIHPVYDPSNKEVYAGYFDTNSIGYIVAISGTKVVADIKVGYLLDNWGQTVAYDPANGDIYASINNGTVVIDGSTNKLIGEIPITAPVGITYDPTNKEVYVAGRDNVSVISSSTNKVVSVVEVGFFPQYFAYDSTNHDMYVTTISNISVISSSNVIVKTITDGNQPAGLIYDPSNTYVYASNIGDDSVLVLSS